MKFSIKKKFDNLSNRIATEYAKSFNAGLEMHRNPSYFVNVELGKLNNEISYLQSSSPELNKAFFNINAMYNEDKQLDYPEAIKRYCKEHKTEPKSICIYVATLTALFYQHDIITAKAKLINDRTADPNENNEQLNCTLAQTVLIMNYLINEVSEKETDFSLDQDKTVTARFIGAVCSNKSRDSKIINTNLYKKVKTLFGHPENASLNDLFEIKRMFDSLGLNKISNKIANTISKIK